MLKKLLVAVLALTIIIGLFSPVLATNEPRTAKQLTQPITKADPVSTRSYPCSIEGYDNTWNYYWPIPDPYGDDFFNQRFTNASACTLKTVYIGFYSGGTVGAPGATIFLSHSDVNGFPDFANPVCASIPVANASIVFDDYTVIDLTTIVPALPVFVGDFNVGYTPIYNDPADELAIFSDGGANPQGRSSEYWGSWGTMLADWGADVNFAIDVEKCCYVPDCIITADPLDQWPVWCHDFGRSSQSGITLGDPCGIANAWSYDVGNPGGVYKFFSSPAPLIVNDLVYAVYSDRVVCLYLTNTYGGSPVVAGTVKWTFVNAGIAGLGSNPAIQDGWLYMGTGSQQGACRIDAVTGALGWGRGTVFGSPLVGQTVYNPPVIIGDEVFITTQSGMIYGLDKATGVTVHSALLTVLPTGGVSAIMRSSMSSDGTNLFIGTGNSTSAPTLGCIYSLKPQALPLTGFDQNWAYVPPTTLLASYPGGFLSAPSYRDGNLFIHPASVYNLVSGGYCVGTGYGGWRMNLNPATGLEKWASYYVQGSARHAPPATICTPTGITAVFANYPSAGCGSSNPATRGIRAVNNATNATMWSRSGAAGVLNNIVYTAVSATQDPYVFYGTADPYGVNLRNQYGGDLVMVNGTTGTLIAKWSLSGYVQGVAIAHGTDDGSGFGNDWIVAITSWSANSSQHSGRVIAFRDKGPRARLLVPSTVVDLAPLQLSDPAMATRTSGAIRNGGCSPLTFTYALSTDPLLPAQTPALVKARIGTVSAEGQEEAENLASSLIDRRVEDLSVMSSSNVSKGFNKEANGLNFDAETFTQAEQIKPATANSARLAVPTWVTLADPGPTAGGTAANLVFTFDRLAMPFLVTSTFYLDVLTSNDPDYNIDNPAAPILNEIQFNVPYVYCVLQQGYMGFGDTGAEYYFGNGMLGDDGGTRLGFTLDGTDDYLYSGSMFFMDSMNSAAWNPQGSSVPAGFGFLMPFPQAPGDCGGCTFAGTFPVAYTTTNGANYSWLTGDVCSFAMIDTGQAFGTYAHQTGPSMGLLIKYREVGAYGPDFGDFKLIVVDIINRNATPVNGLYYGADADWDVASGNNNGNGNAVDGISYLNDGAVVRGYVGLPLRGSMNLDGTATDPMYNALIIGNPDWVYPSATCPECLLDSLYAGIDARPEGAISYTASASASGAADDLSLCTAFGKVDLAGGATKSYAFAMWGSNSATSPLVDMAARAKFINKFSGFGRGDFNNDNLINLSDIVKLANYVANPGTVNGPVPFRHLGDVNCDGVMDAADVTYMVNYFFHSGPAPKGQFMF